MRLLPVILALSAVVSCGFSRQHDPVVNNPVNVKMGDPFVMRASDGQYYMYGTTFPRHGFGCYSSVDLIEWSYEGLVYKGHQEDSWTEHSFWAPEVYEKDGRFYMFFSASWNALTGKGERYRIGVAVADSPTGPFTDLTGKPLFDPGYPVVDPHVLADDDGRYWLYFSSCCEGNPVETQLANLLRNKGIFDEIEESWIYVVELESDFTSVKGNPVVVIRPAETLTDPQYEWESRSVLSGEINRRWSSGACVVKHDSEYYLMYSANNFMGDDYSIGYAKSSSPTGPFVKSDSNPVLQKNLSSGGGVMGVGHNSVIWTENGNMYCVYHARTSRSGFDRVVFIDRMEIRRGQLKIYGPTLYSDDTK